MEKANIAVAIFTVALSSLVIVMVSPSLQKLGNLGRRRARQPPPSEAGRSDSSTTPARPGASRNLIARATGRNPRATASVRAPQLPRVDTTQLLEDLASGKKECLYQEQSLLFQLPPEIRNQIFKLAVSEQDGKRAIPNTSYFYRPEYTHYRYIDTALLRTCKRAWLETHSLPRQGIVRMRWLTSGDRAPNRLIYSQQAGALTGLASLAHIPDFQEQRAVLPCQVLHIFAQMFVLEGGERLPRLLAAEQKLLPLRHVILTLRYTDWWFWEGNEQLRISEDWAVNSLELPDTVEKVSMEFETRNGKKVELDWLIDSQIQNWELSTKSGAKLILEDGQRSESSESQEEDERPEALRRRKKVETSTWVGSDKPGGRSRVPLHHTQRWNGTEGLNEGEMLYSVATMVWKKVVS